MLTLAMKRSNHYYCSKHYTEKSFGVTKTISYNMMCLCETKEYK